MKSLPRSTAKDVFSHLLAIVTLYVGVISFMTLLFQYINVQFPDALNDYYIGSLDMIRGAMAALIVIWPVHLIISWFVNKERRANSSDEGGIRKWLIYLTLFVTAITMIVDLITFVNYFLNGELSVRFVLKVSVVLLTAGLVFWYQHWELKHDIKHTTSVYKTAAIASMIIVVGTIIGGFFLVGTPGQQRQVRFDEQRVNDLQNIQYEVINYYQQKQTLPATLTELNNTMNGHTMPVDPETQVAYEYTAGTELAFSLCANFSQPSVGSETDRQVMPYSQNWEHGIGRTCFDRTIDPDLYPPLESTLGVPVKIR